MRVYFINYHRFQDASGIHIHFLANALERLGVRCVACVPDHPGSVHSCGPVSYRSMGFAELRARSLFRPGSLRDDAVLIHAWTPREIVRRMTTMAARHTGAPYIVHLEDNEEQIFASSLGVDVDQAHRLPLYRRLRLPKGLVHPARYRGFLAGAAGMTCIMQSLERMAPPGTPVMTFWPACEPEFFTLPSEPDMGARRTHGIPAEAVVLTYTGNVHPANRDEVQTLYAAVIELNRRGRCVRLIRCGGTHAAFDRSVRKQAEPYVIELGSRPSSELIHYVGAADILVQPGRPGPFNNDRFPSKIPMYLASGKPVVLPATNIGVHLTAGENCLLLHEGTTEELVAILDMLIADQALRDRLGRAGRQFACEHFSWDRSAEQVLRFYVSVLKQEAVMGS